MGKELMESAIAPMPVKAGQRLRIAYLCVNDPLDKRSWSGITYYVGQSLQRNVGDVDFLGPVTPSPFVEKLMRGISKLTWILFRKVYQPKHSALLGWHFGKKLSKKLKDRQYDCIVAPAASTELAFTKLNAPTIYLSDTTFNLIAHFYKWEYEKTPSFSKWEGNYVEKRALQKSSAIILSSQWAADSAMKDYGIPREKILVMPLGANMDFVPDEETIFLKEQNSQLTLLYLAVEWERKGGSIAYDTFLKLHEQGIKAKLIVCGCIPPPQFAHPYMEVIPFLNKNKKEDHEKFVSLLSSVHFLLLPTRADCSLLVACEANAYGVPAITTQIGGVPDVVIDEVNGYCLPFEASSDAYANCISKIYADKERYHKLIRTSRKRFEERLNWDKWAEDFKELYQSIAK